MKPTEITMQIVKYLGNYETCRLEASFTLDATDDLTQSFVMARRELEKAYAKCYGIKPKLTEESEKFKRICKALHDGKTDIDELREHFDVSDVMGVFKEKGLI